MKSKFHLLIATVIAAIMLHSEKINAQNWLTTGNSGITTSNFIGATNNADLIFKTNNIEGGRLLKTSVWQFGTTTNFVKIDLTGKLTFGGTGAYQVAGNKYAFQYTGDPDYGLFFNSTNVRYEFRNGSAVPIFYVDANNGNSVFNGTLKVGAYTLPAIDGLNGQVLKTNGVGALSWSNDNNSGGSGANTSLSNLTGTAINQSLLAATDNTIDLGSNSKSWRNIYLGSSLYLKGSIALHSAGTENFFVGNGAGNTSLTGSVNTGVGQVALTQLTSGSYNTASGYASLSLNTTGSYNTASGYASLIFNTAGSYNTANGSSALYSNAGGYSNTANGYSALQANTNGGDNTATGVNAMYSNTTGSYNSSYGRFSMFSNTTGSSNIAVGANALYSNTTGYSNIAIGVGSLYSNTMGSNLVAVGDSALYHNGAGAGQAMYNTAVGSKSLYSNTTGYRNTAYGKEALYYNTTGFSNTAIGFLSLYNNSGGYYNTATGSSSIQVNTTGDYNTATGSGSLHYNMTGKYNTANGFEALSNNWDFSTARGGDFNTANGSSALYNNSGDYNTASGLDALSFNRGDYNTTSGTATLNSNETGSANTALGFRADVYYSNLTNATAIGAYAIVDASNKVRFGDISVRYIGGQVGWTSYSDDRYKKGVKENIPGLTFINELRPITYIVNVKGLNEYYNKGRKPFREINDEKMDAERAKSEDAAGKIIYSGFIAQEVEEAAKKLNFEFSGVDKPQNKDGLYGLRYDNFVVPLVKAMQELSKMNIEKDAEIAELKPEIDELKKIVLSLKQNFEKCNPSSQQSGIGNQVSKTQQQETRNKERETAKLEQNIPNPFNYATTINYTLPQKYSSAQIIIADKTGKVLKEINISGSGKGSLKVDASTLASGVYNYSLYVNRKFISSKQMIAAK